MPHLLELIHNAKEYDHRIIIVGQTVDVRPKAARETQILSWAQVEANGAQVVNAATPPSVRESCLLNSPAVHGLLLQAPMIHLPLLSPRHLPEIDKGYALPTPISRLVSPAIRALFPPSIALSTLDTIVSGHSLSTPFGRAVAYTALYEGACFATYDSTRTYYNPDIESSASPRNINDILSTSKLPIPSSTVLVLHPNHVQDLSTVVLSRAKKSSFIYPVMWRHKLAALVPTSTCAGRRFASKTPCSFSSSKRSKS